MTTKQKFAKFMTEAQKIERYKNNPVAVRNTLKSLGFRSFKASQAGMMLEELTDHAEWLDMKDEADRLAETDGYYESNPDIYQ